MAISDKLNKILDTKQKIQTSINERQGAVTSDTIFGDYPDKIKEIPTWWTGVTAPDNTVGLDGDFYFKIGDD